MNNNLHEVQIEWAGEENAFVGQTGNAASSIQIGDTLNQAGHSPMNLFLLSLAGCTAMTVRAILIKMQQPVEDVRVKVRGWSTDEDPNVKVKLYDEIVVEYSLWGEGIDPQKVETAIQKADEKYCPVSRMVGKAAKIKYEFHIYKPGEAGK